MNLFEIQSIENIYNSWKKCKDNHSYIENIHNTQIILSKDNFLPENQIDTNKRTINFTI